jgi:hypothetical protein
LTGAIPTEVRVQQLAKLECGVNLKTVMPCEPLSLPEEHQENPEQAPYHTPTEIFNLYLVSLRGKDERQCMYKYAILPSAISGKVFGHVVY